MFNTTYGACSTAITKVHLYIARSFREVATRIQSVHATAQQTMLDCSVGIKLSVYACGVCDTAASVDRFTNSCASHRFVVASSLSTLENVPSRSGSGRHCRRASRALSRDGTSPKHKSNHKFSSLLASPQLALRK